MGTKKAPTQSKRTIRTAIKEIWNTYLVEADEAWRAYGRSIEPNWVARRTLLESLEAACRKALNEIAIVREEEKHANENNPDQ